MTPKPATIDAVEAATDEVVLTKGDDRLSLVNKDDVMPDDDNEVVGETLSSSGVGVDGGNPKTLHRKGSGSYIRAHDLDIPCEMKKGGKDVASSMLHESMQNQAAGRGRGRALAAAADRHAATEGMFFMDEDFKLTLDKLVQLAYAEATDEGSRFVPGRETANTLRKREKQPFLKPTVDPDWPIQLWHAANPSNLRDVLIWNGLVRNIEGYGHDWPIVKARGIVPASPRDVAHFLWDSTNVNQYNNMSVGRHDGTVFQEGFDTCAEDSVYGFEGAAKVLRSYNKIKLVPRIVEIVSILHIRPLQPPMASPGTYLIVNRSIWESDGWDEDENVDQSNSYLNASGAHAKNKLIRSEMLLGVQLLRPLNGGQHCEMTTVTHALVPGMNNKTVAKAAANVSAAKILRDIQAAFMK